MMMNTKINNIQRTIYGLAGIILTISGFTLLFFTIISTTLGFVLSLIFNLQFSLLYAVLMSILGIGMIVGGFIIFIRNQTQVTRFLIGLFGLLLLAIAIVLSLAINVGWSGPQAFGLLVLYASAFTFLQLGFRIKLIPVMAQVIDVGEKTALGRITTR